MLPDKDPLFFVKKQIDLLRTYKQSLDKVIIVAPHCAADSPEVHQWLRDVNGTTIQGATVEVLRRENFGQSYGSWSHAFRHETINGGRKWDWWFFMEDDYAYVIDNFDDKMREVSKERPGYLCGAAWRNDNSMPLVAAISNGLATHDILMSVWDRFGMLPHFAEGVNYQSKDQVEFSRAFVAVGQKLQDTRGLYSVVFCNPTPPAQRFHGDHLPIIMAGIHWICAPVELKANCEVVINRETEEFSAMAPVPRRPARQAKRGVHV